MPTAAIFMLALKASLMLMVLGLGLQSTMRDASYLARHPAQLARSFLAMSVLMPLLAVSLATTFALTPAVSFALVALTLSPVPPFLPGRAIRAGGDSSYAVGLLVAASLASIVVVPLSVALLGALFATPLRVQLLPIAKLVGVGILLPLAIGIGARAAAPAAASRIAKPITLLSVVVLAAALIPILRATWPAMRELIGNGTLAAIAGMTLAGLAIGHLLGGPDRDDRAVLALATAMRHPAVAISILASVAPGGKYVPVVVLALLVGAIASMPYTVWSGRRRRPSSNAPRAAPPAEFEAVQGQQRRAKAPSVGKQPRRE
jgi:BASS family bile acid:Na+ symporter